LSKESRGLTIIPDGAGTIILNAAGSKPVI
jgi:hypothetical protein